MVLNPNTIKSILFIRTDRLGDFLLNLPAIKALKEGYPKARLSVLLHPSLVDLIKDHPDIYEAISFTPILSEKNWLKWGLFFWRLKKKRYDVVIISNPHKLFHLFTYLIGIPYRVGYARKWGFLLTHSLPDSKAQSLKHEVEYNLELVAQIGAPLSSEFSGHTYSIPLSIQDELSFETLAQHKGLDLKKPFIAINPYTTASFKQWPIHRLVELIQKLCAYSSTQIVLIGGSLERDLIKKEILPSLLPSLASSVFDFSGHLNLKQLAVLLKKATLLISNDSGPVHIAAAFNTKTVVLFGKQPSGSNSKRWGPWDPLNKAGHIIIQKDKVEDIEVQDVWKHIQSTCPLSS